MLWQPCQQYLYRSAGVSDYGGFFRLCRLDIQQIDHFSSILQKSIIYFYLFTPSTTEQKDTGKINMNAAGSSGVQSGLLVRDEYGYYVIPPESPPAESIPSESIPSESIPPELIPSELIPPEFIPSEPISSELPLPEPATPQSSISQRRSSVRRQKRKKFDDEVVETTFLHPSAPRTLRSNSTTRSKLESSGFDDSTLSSGIIHDSKTIPVGQSKRIQTPRLTTPSNISNGAGWRSVCVKNKSHSQFNNSLKGLGRWKPTDDLALIIGVQQTNDLKIVHRGTKFSCHFTLQEVQHRWHALLYDSDVSKLAVQAMKNLHPAVIANVQSRALFSRDEEFLLEAVKSTPEPTLDIFQRLLETSPHIFHPMRTAKTLMYHWQLMKHYQLLPDQSVQPLPYFYDAVSFSDAEDMMNDKELGDPKDEMVDTEMAIANRHDKLKIRVLENEVTVWLALINTLTDGIPLDFDDQTFAILNGKHIKYRMTSKEITVGRSSKDRCVDVDLSSMGPAKKVSRRQATIRMKNNGDFFLSSEGKRPIFVNGRPILPGNKIKLQNNSVIEVASFQFVFLINLDLIPEIRNQSEKKLQYELKPQKPRKRNNDFFNCTIEKSHSLLAP
uniref:Mcrs1_0 protein n=1 Tax=Fopius arisanus TaxID=64838 RepID=A0A0C9R6T0_9HYME